MIARSHGKSRAFLVAQLVKNPPALQGDPGSIPGLGGSPGEGIVCPLQFTGFPGGSDGKESTSSVGDLGSIPGSGRSPGGGHGNPFKYSCLENLHGQRSLVGYSSWDRKESDTTDRLSITHCYLLSAFLILASYSFIC